MSCPDVFSSNSVYVEHAYVVLELRAPPPKSRNSACALESETLQFVWSCVHQVASSPAPSQLFSLAGKKRERAWDLKSRDKCWQNGVALAVPQSVDFKPVWRLRSIKRSSARPLRIVLPSLTVSVAFFFTRIEPERSKIALAHAQFSRSATLPTQRRLFTIFAECTFNYRAPYVMYCFC